MKFRRMFLVFLVIMCALPSFSAFAAGKDREIQLFLNDRRIHTDVPPYLDKKTSTTMVPMRVISESLGADVQWIDQQARINTADTSIILTHKSSIALVNGQEVALDLAVSMVSGRVLVPLRFVAENLGVTVNWDGVNRTISMVADQDVAASEELRGAWIASVTNIDWPSKSSYSNMEQQKTEYIQQLDDLKGMGINAVFVQVRPTADAFYPSEFFPWSKYLTGVQGKDPGYDPLAFMIEETHARGMEFHAWFNPFRVSMDTKLENLTSDHPARVHPDWVVKHQGKLWFDPGVPEVRQYVEDSIIEVVENYDIDGVHFDDYFYPYGQNKEPFPDDASFAAHSQGQFKDRDEWRRNNVNQFIQQLGSRIKETKSHVRYGVSPFGVWRNAKLDPSGSDTNAGINSYDDLHADVRTWIQEGWIDYVVPQIYWSIGFKAAAYDKLVDWWVQETVGTDVDLYIGHAPYKLGTTEAGWNTADQIINQLEYNKKAGKVSGSIYFSAKNLRSNVLGIGDRLTAYYNEK